MGMGTMNQPLRLAEWSLINTLLFNTNIGMGIDIYMRAHNRAGFVCEKYANEHTVRRRGRFIAPVFRTETNGFNVQNGGNTQHYFGEFRGYGHDESAPTSGGMVADKYIMR